MGMRALRSRAPYRQLIRINRKGRPFVTCSVCNETPCPRPREHYKLQNRSRVKKMKPASKNKITRRVSSHANQECLRLAPRPTETSTASPTVLSTNGLTGPRQVHVPVNTNTSVEASNQLPSLTLFAPNQQQQHTTLSSRCESFTAPGIPLIYTYRDTQLPVTGAIESETSGNSAVRLPSLRTHVQQNHTACDMVKHLLPSNSR
ncbi:hypothetical protein BDV38DRAFT_11117 [Aspergillus pseudotamarii]|uniref:Uncharacterized protein n=1 Tax=Aspergillus pseudotamarii TaxID=132259 RepID=A0A5N6T3Q4_ASPPS|nr:uncharacterized protein BDV38DRAFT_11117 [Aspergillus pseudotamarii]KAE8140922.1 hypothetical protein BDV38DRAFT_11117 [Aspergillus pseudotamarii]